MPPAVLEALRQGKLIDAIKLLRSSGMGLKDAKDALDAHVRRKPPASAPTFSAPAMGQALPPGVVDALRKGQKIEAIRLMREQTGLGLKEAREAVDAYELTHIARPDGLSPGQVGNAGFGVWWVVTLVLACVLAYMVLRRFA